MRQLAGIQRISSLMKGRSVWLLMYFEVKYFYYA